MKALRHRPARVLPAVLVSIVMLALAAALLWAAIARLATGQWWSQLSRAAQSVEQAPWAAPGAMVAAAVVAIIGLLLIIWALAPGAFTTARVASPEPEDAVVRGGVHAVITTGGLATLASGAAHQIDGVSGVRSSATAKSVLVSLTTPLRSRDSLVAEVRAAVEERMRRSGVFPAPKIRVRAHTKEMS
ncbi:DUF6286 domain-containing protein [Rothia halotolerans]|uniref:DUF6286 domain-containing protein n=1 Tax=Rothia halotolerans TaxID=405770 RepID=UPI00101D024F|nr:DUF6286 domain-containing protein [Rothia halotolerans]